MFGPALVYLAISIPLLLLGEGAKAGARGWFRWRAVPLAQKSHTRSGLASFVLVALAIYIVKRGFSSMGGVELICVAGIAAFAALWLVVGVVGSRGVLRFDRMSLFWFGVVCLGAIALLIKGVPF